MADVKPVGEGAELPEKRKLDTATPVSKSLEVNNDESDSNKRPKTEVPSQKNGSNSPPPAENAEEPEEEDEENDSDEDGDEEPKIVDRKGKGIMIDDKGKGKMVEDSEDDDDSDDDDSSSDDSDSDFSDGLDESDWEDDPLAEVDLDNILPSRTRRPQAQSGVRIGGFADKGNDV